MIDQKEEPSYYAIITADVRYDNRLKANEKLMYGEITALSSKNGFCYASNNYFADLYQVSKETVSRWIKNLIECGYLESKIEYHPGTKQVKNRYLTLLTKKSIGYCEKDQYPIDENIKGNTTRVNNTSKSKKFVSDILEDIEIDDLVAYRKSIGKKLMTEKAFNGLVNNIKKVMDHYGVSFKEVFEVLQEKQWASIKIDWVKENFVKVDTKGGNDLWM